MRTPASHGPATTLRLILAAPRRISIRAAGSGKTALAAQLAVQSGFPFVKLISADSMLGMSDSGRCAHIAAVFNDAYKSPMSMIILDDLERLLGA